MHEVVQSVDAYKISIDGAELQFAVSATDEFYQVALAGIDFYGSLEKMLMTMNTIYTAY